MTVEESIYRQVQLIKSDFLNGSTTITLKAMEIVTAALDLKGNVDNSFAINIANRLKKSKPAMAAISVICDYIISDFYRCNSLGIKYFSNSVRNKFMYAKHTTLDKAYNKLFKGRNSEVLNIVTCSFSSNVLDLLTLAHRKGRNINVLIVESYFHSKNLSTILSYELQKQDISSHIINIEQLSELLPVISFALIGADGFDEKGNAVNGIPSSDMLKICYGKIYAYIVAESFKKVNELTSDTGFDFIDSKYIKEIISDEDDWTVPLRTEKSENSSLITA